MLHHQATRAPFFNANAGQPDVNQDGADGGMENVGIQPGNVAQAIFNNPVYMAGWNHDMGSGTIVLPSVATIQGANFSINNQAFNLHQNQQLLADNDQDFQLQLQYAVSESLQQMQQQINNNVNPSINNNDGMDDQN